MKNKKSILKIILFNIIIEFILGTLLHFTFQWSNNNLIVGAFSSVNESVWEHLKLLFFPMLLTTFISYFYVRKEFTNYLCSRTISIITSILFIIIFFYTYTGIIGTSFTIIDIASFFIAVLLGEFVTFKLTTSNYKCNNLISLIVLLVLLFCFIFFTYFPIKINLFKDPITSSYGII